METDVGLLEYLAACLHCEYLSSLRQPSLASSIRRVLQSVPADRYFAGEWEDALHYLTDTRKAGSVPAEQVREDLLQFLEHGAVEAPFSMQ